MKNMKSILILACGVISAAPPAHADLGNLIDVFTLCYTCRERDKANAERDEAVARANREAEEKAHQEKISNLNKAIDNKNKEIQSWKDLNVKSPEVQQALDKIIEVASAVRAERENSGYFIGRIKKLFKGYNHELDTMNGLFQSAIESPQTVNVNAQPSADRRFDSAKQIIDTLQNMAATKREELSDFIEKAANAASDDTLAMFISQAVVLRDYVVDISTKIDLQIKNHNDEKETMENQLAQLIEQSKPAPPPPPPAPTSRPLPELPVRMWMFAH